MKCRNPRRRDCDGEYGVERYTDRITGQPRVILTCSKCGHTIDSELSKYLRVEKRFGGKEKRDTSRLMRARLKLAKDARAAGVLSEKEYEKERYNIIKKYAGKDRAERAAGKIETPGFSLPSTAVGGVKISAGTILVPIIGVIISALLGSTWFFFACLAWGAYLSIPNVGEIRSVRRHIRQIKNRYESKRKAIDRRGGLSDENRSKLLAELSEQAKNELQMEKIISSVGVKGRASGLTILKEGLKVLGIVSFIGAFLWSDLSSLIPFSKFVGLIIAFAAYFFIGGTWSEEGGTE